MRRINESGHTWMSNVTSESVMSHRHVHKSCHIRIHRSLLQNIVSFIGLCCKSEGVMSHGHVHESCPIRFCHIRIPCGSLFASCEPDLCLCFCVSVTVMFGTCMLTFFCLFVGPGGWKDIPTPVLPSLPSKMMHQHDVCETIYVYTTSYFTKCVMCVGNHMSVVPR